MLRLVSYSWLKFPWDVLYQVSQCLFLTEGRAKCVCERRIAVLKISEACKD